MTDPDRDTQINHDERDDRAGTEFGGAYGEDDTPMPTDTAATLGDPPRGEARYDTSFTSPGGSDGERDGEDGEPEARRGEAEARRDEHGA